MDVATGGCQYDCVKYADCREKEGKWNKRKECKHTRTSSKANTSRDTTTLTKILLLNTHLRNRNGKVNTPTETRLRKEDKRNHSPLISRRDDTKQRAKDNHNEDRARQLPVPATDRASKDSQTHGTEENRQALRQRQHDRVLPVRAAVRVEHGDHLRPQDAGGVVEHVDDAEGDDGGCEVAPVRAREDVCWCERELEVAEGFVQREAD